MKDKQKNKKEIKTLFDFTPTNEQEELLKALVNFVDNDKQNTFIFKGAAGTGKTSVLKAVVKYLSNNNLGHKLLAPTGRAASIISSKTGFAASTIHSHLYRVVEVKDNDDNVLYIEFVKRQNINTNPCIYLIDEASMIGDIPNTQDYYVSKKPLLQDLISFISEGHKDNKVIFIGDPYQLPPINSHESPALSVNYLQDKYNRKCNSFELTLVKRQDENSYILDNAMQLRSGIKNNLRRTHLQFETLESEDYAVEQYCQNLRNGAANKSIFLAWKNVSINTLNNKMRKMLYDSNTPLFPGERIILSQSNYADTYLSSGTFLIVEEIIGDIEEIAGLRFATVKLRQVDPDELLPGEFKIELGSLISENGRSDGNKMKTLWHERYKINKKLQRTKDARSDAYLSALKARYAYAITTHKAQGGEWDNVYLYPEVPFGPNGMRWLYTSVTRARKHLYSFA